MELNAYSRLKHLLKQQRISVPELHRRIRSGGFRVNLKSLYRLSDEDQPVHRLDMRVAGAICEVCDVPLSEWIVFEPEEGRLRMLDSDKQERLDLLMTKSSAGRLTEAERDELRTLVREAEEITLSNARLLAEQRHQLAPPPSGAVGSAL
jgi:hypothetical protein